MNDPHDIELVTALKDMFHFAKSGHEIASLFLASSRTMLKDQFDKWIEIWNLYQSDIRAYGEEKAIEKIRNRLQPFIEKHG
ncbi:hypothetical protein [Brevibacillus laterosporus]|uniref:hypothetical protein n=1 Tax=Brevibacillus laterosporus TaxID=1465 RepID=UPI000839B494|nr:hypothetical protein [Brevibacillus laterosporus]